jgi:alpha-1,3-rhamnosyl/mannosyltransferase
VATLHDLSGLLHPEWHPPERVKYFERNFPRCLQQCRHFITVSRSVRLEVIRQLNVPPHRVTAVYNGARPEMRPLPPDHTARVLRGLRLEPGYLLYLGAIEPRKNLLMLLRAYCALPRALRERCPLLLVGPCGWKFQAVADYYHAHGRHRGVRHLGYLADRYLPAVYNGARALVCPSFYEGFGLPCVEMMACGGAVLASTAGVFQETLGGQAQLIPAEDGDAWRAGMEAVLGDNDRCRQLRQGALRRAQRYTWGQCAAGTLSVYRAVAGDVTVEGPLQVPA